MQELYECYFHHQCYEQNSSSNDASWSGSVKDLMCSEGFELYQADKETVTSFGRNYCRDVQVQFGYPPEDNGYAPPSPSLPSAARVFPATSPAATARRYTNIIERRNQRERVRVRMVNEAFARLRQMVPATRSSSKRVSKVKTLKRAVDYIGELRRRLATFESFLTDASAGMKSSQSSTAAPSAADRRWKKLPPN
ncbi:achaete-scute homolog 2-like [Wyeomyia smithii]|uniref:achaete-scute homolog 2-like n=1 Tax=Wyeomyia smithii TaxID=174621 RepID=UPI002467F20D|nr:achaete-scute homolog 2-like [Wyeomyia smithii]